MQDSETLLVSATETIATDENSSLPWIHHTSNDTAQNQIQEDAEELFQYKQPHMVKHIEQTNITIYNQNIILRCGTFLYTFKKFYNYTQDVTNLHSPHQTPSIYCDTVIHEPDIGYDEEQTFSCTDNEREDTEEFQDNCNVTTLIATAKTVFGAQPRDTTISIPIERIIVRNISILCMHRSYL